MMRTLLACLLAVACCACGDDPAKGPKGPLEDLMRGNPQVPGFPGMPTGLPGMTPGTGPTDFLQLGKIELTDEIMASYVEVVRAFADMKGQTPSLQVLQAHSLDLQRWAAVSAAIARSHMPSARDSLGGLEKQLASARARLATAPEAQRAGLQQQVDAYERALEQARATLPEEEPDDVDRRNYEVVQRWMDRIKAAGRDE